MIYADVPKHLAAVGVDVDVDVGARFAAFADLSFSFRVSLTWLFFAI